MNCPLCVDREGQPHRNPDCPKCGGFGEVGTFRSALAALVRRSVDLFLLFAALVFGPLLALIAIPGVTKGTYDWAHGKLVGDLVMSWWVFGIGTLGTILWAGVIFLFVRG